MLNPLNRSARRGAGERGASAVEFALVVPLLLLFLFATVSCARAFQIQATVSGAAREAARTMAITNSTSKAQSAALYAATSSAVDLTASQVSISPGSCTGASSTTNVVVTIVYRYQPLGVFNNGVAIDITSKAVVRCGG